MTRLRSRPYRGPDNAAIRLSDRNFRPSIRPPLAIAPYNCHIGLLRADLAHSCESAPWHQREGGDGGTWSVPRGALAHTCLDRGSRSHHCRDAELCGSQFAIRPLRCFYGRPLTREPLQMLLPVFSGRLLIAPRSTVVTTPALMANSSWLANRSSDAIS